MSIATVEHIIKRIAVATRQSPIAVFTTSCGLDAVFGATIQTQKEIEEGNPAYVGSFYANMDLDSVQAMLEEIK